MPTEDGFRPRRSKRDANCDKTDKVVTLSSPSHPSILCASGSIMIEVNPVKPFWGEPTSNANKPQRQNIPQEESAIDE
ncbi:hypothetical protein PHISCL_05482 [Aspergillus sclerotialis]|uniref:Uncharacterized protein n=1 Tax=Aspergillus sclerotialis TaxID=2070753 RepID=A0A3A2ZGS1_9EURO|nr:hypothetical protein PHISCL_05482 [Aspergillus sclerotialis]